MMVVFLFSPHGPTSYAYGFASDGRSFTAVTNADGWSLEYRHRGVPPPAQAHHGVWDAAAYSLRSAGSQDRRLIV